QQPRPTGRLRTGRVLHPPHARPVAALHPPRVCPANHRGAAAPRWLGREVIAYRRPLLLVAGLVPLLAASTSPNSRQATLTSQGSAGPTRRDYWPTAGWRTAAPKDE